MKILVVGAWATVSVIDVENGYVKALREAGHEVYNYQLSARLDEAAKDLDKRWRRSARQAGYAKPNGADYAYFAGKDLIERALWFNPDWIVVIGGKCLHPQLMHWLSRRLNLKMAVVLTESPYEDADQAQFIPLFDLAWTNERTSVDVLRKALPFTFYLPHAYDPAKHTPDLAEDAAVLWPNERGVNVGTRVRDLPSHEVVFVGTGFPERIELLSKVDWSGIDFGLYGHWSLLGSRSPLRKYLRGGILENEATAALYRRSAIGLNLYRTSEHLDKGAARSTTAESLNPRAYELAATGCFQISSGRAEVRDVFGDAVPTFSTPHELEALVRGYLGNPDHRRDCVDWAYRAVAGCTYAERAQAMLRDMVRYEALIREGLPVQRPTLVEAS